MKYELFEPLITREKGKDVSVTHLPIPAKITFAQIRQIEGLDTPKQALKILELCGGLDRLAVKMLPAYEAIGYFEAIKEAGLLEPKPAQDYPISPDFDCKRIKMVGGLIDGMDARLDKDPTAYTLELLKKSDFDMDKVNDMDFRDWQILQGQVVGLFTRPKRSQTQ